jgi:hypothetical protein
VAYVVFKKRKNIMKRIVIALSASVYWCGYDCFSMDNWTGGPPQALANLDAAGAAFIAPANPPELEIAAKRLNAIAGLVIATYQNEPLGRLVTANPVFFADKNFSVLIFSTLADKNFFVLTFLTLIAMAEFGAV